MKNLKRNSTLVSQKVCFFIILLLVWIGPWSFSEARPSSKDSDDIDYTDLQWKESELGRVKLAILNELGLHMNADQVAHIDRLPKGNISEAEYRRAYGEYMRRVRMRNFEQKALMTYGFKDRRRNARRVMKIFNPETIHTYDNVETRLNFKVNLNLERRSHLRIRRALVSLPDGCYYFDLEKNETFSKEVDITEKLILWILRKNDEGIPKESFGLTLFCHPPQDITGLSEPFSREDDLKMTSLKIISTEEEKSNFLKDEKRKRKKRSYSLRNYETHPTVRSRDCDKTRHGKTCCRRSMKINFEDLNIRDLILEPKEFDAHMCSGRCNARRVPYATTHAMLQHTLHQTKGRNEIPRPCCTPTKLRHLDVLHTVPGTDTLKITILANAIVEECSCS